MDFVTFEPTPAMLTLQLSTEPLAHPRGSERFAGMRIDECMMNMAVPADGASDDGECVAERQQQR
jgi:hypothetical protein